MIFDWVAFCRAHHIPFVTEGPNVARNDINIRCPFCGVEDPSEHMGLSKNPRRPWFSCWRNTAHRGPNPIRLIIALLHCSVETAKALVDAGDVSSIDRYEEVAGKMSHGSSLAKAAPAAKPLSMPKEFKPVTKTGYGAAFYDYLLAERGFTNIADLVEWYDLRYCVVGHFRYRLIVPIYLKERLVSWTGRDITKKSAVRYRTLSDDPEKAADQGYPPAVLNLKSTVLNADLATGGTCLFVCEGPFDALKLDWFTEQGNAVAVFGMPEAQQLAILCRLARNYRRINVTLDADAKARSVGFVEQLRSVSPVPVVWQQLPAGCKDPGELKPDVARTLGNC